MWPVLGFLFIAQQSSYFSVQHGADGPIGHVKIAAWIVTSIILLLAVATGGAWAAPKQIRALVEDETTLHNRQAAMATAFLASMSAAIIIYALSLYEPVSGREAVHFIMTIGIASALIGFGFRERRAMRDG